MRRSREKRDLGAFRISRLILLVPSHVSSANVAFVWQRPLGSATVVDWVRAGTGDPRREHTRASAPHRRRGVGSPSLLHAHLNAGLSRPKPAATSRSRAPKAPRVFLKKALDIFRSHYTFINTR